MSTSRQELVADGMLSVDEAMEFLSVSRSHLYELMDRREIPWAKIGRSRRIPKAALVAYVAANLKGVDPLGTLERD
jgi:excisionase family DNA binding protein